MCEPTSNLFGFITSTTTGDGIPVPSITNVATTATLGCELDPEFISRNVWNSEYNPSRLLGSLVILRIRSPRATAQIFRNGKMVCLGTKSVESAKKASRRFGRIIQKLGYNVKFQNFKVWNLVGRCEIKTTVPLDKFMGFLSKNDAVDASWNPELFPSLTYRLSGDKPKVSLNVFKTGKVTITGAKHHREMVHVFNSFHQHLLEFKRNLVKEKVRLKMEKGEKIYLPQSVYKMLFHRSPK